MDQSGWDKRKFLTNADLFNISSASRSSNLIRAAGQHFEYSNTNYALLALIIEKVSGESYSEFLTKTFFQPLKMEDSYVFQYSDTAEAMRSYKIKRTDSIRWNTWMWSMVIKIFTAPRMIC